MLGWAMATTGRQGRRGSWRGIRGGLVPGRWRRRDRPAGRAARGVEAGGGGWDLGARRRPAMALGAFAPEQSEEGDGEREKGSALEFHFTRACCREW